MCQGRVEKVAEGTRSNHGDNIEVRTVTLSRSINDQSIEEQPIDGRQKKSKELIF